MPGNGHRAYTLQITCITLLWYQSYLRLCDFIYSCRNKIRTDGLVVTPLSLPKPSTDPICPLRMIPYRYSSRGCTHPVPDLPSHCFIATDQRPIVSAVDSVIHILSSTPFMPHRVIPASKLRLMSSTVSSVPTSTMTHNTQELDL